MQHTTQGRRLFLARLSGLAAGGAAGVGASLADRPEVYGAEPAAQGEEVHELDAWIAGLKGEYRLALDSVSPRGATEITGYASTIIGINAGPCGIALGAARREPEMGWS